MLETAISYSHMASIYRLPPEDTGVFYSASFLERLTFSPEKVLNLKYVYRPHIWEANSFLCTRIGGTKKWWGRVLFQGSTDPWSQARSAHAHLRVSPAELRLLKTYRPLLPEIAIQRARVPDKPASLRRRKKWGQNSPAWSRLSGKRMQKVRVILFISEEHAPFQRLSPVLGDLICSSYLPVCSFKILCL